MADLTFHIVTGSNAVKKRIVLISVLFVVILIIIALSAFVFHNVWIPVVAFVVFAIIARTYSKKDNKVIRIGTMHLSPAKISLTNDKLGVSRDIGTGSLASIRIRGGIKDDPEEYVNSKSLIVDLILASGEIVSVQIEVEHHDEDTCDLIDAFAVKRKIPCSRKI